MLISICPPSFNAPALSPAQSSALLEFCRSLGATRFTANFIYAQGDAENERLMSCFYDRLRPFSAGKANLENIFGNGFQEQECWLLDERSIETIVKESNGDLLSYDACNLPEDWVVYVDDSILLQVVTHEREAILRLTEQQYTEFKNLGISHTLGLPQWTGLPEQPVRKARRWWEVLMRL
jgi:hypothetical protein